MPESLSPSDRSVNPRRRGAPPGNLNALKHGFYSRKFHPLEITDLDSCESAGLADEISMMRVHIRRVVDLGHKAKTLPQSIDLLRALSLAVTSLTRLMRVQKYISGSGGLEDDLKKALADLDKEMNLSGNYPPPLP